MVSDVTFLSATAVIIRFDLEKSNPKLAIFGIARDIAPLVSPKSHSALVQSWITHCLQTHSACGQSPDCVLPTRLLDISPRLDSSVILVTTQSLPISPEVPLYATLSHCWGVKHFIKTTLSNVSSFTTSIPFDDLPRTFQDAISLARELGIKYIWIDSLCIIQDSQEDWKHESALMASVYSNSYLNIAATGSSDSSQAFLSSRDQTHNSVSIPTKPPVEGGGGKESGAFVRTSLDKVHKIYSTPSQNVHWSSVANGNTEAPLLSRAWVFQERHLAPRTLHFHPSELVMECRAGLRCECTGLDSFTSNPLQNFDDMSFTSWYGVVEEFSRLKLTYQTDRLEALMGVGKVFWEKLSCKYLNGVWQGDVAKGLLWNVTRYETLNASSGGVRRQGKEVAPTWSWASLVLTAGNRIFFPIGDDRLFRSDDRFQFLDTEPPGERSQSHFRSESGAILVKSAFVDAIACFVACEGEAENDVLLIFQEDFNDTVLIGTSVLDMDVSLEFEEPLADTIWEVSCLLLGSAEEKDWETNQPVIYNHMLVLQPSSDILGAWERIGILNIKEEVGIHLGLAEQIFKLV
jgi:hypothetical protein